MRSRRWTSAPGFTGVGARSTQSVVEPLVVPLAVVVLDVLLNDEPQVALAHPHHKPGELAGVIGRPRPLRALPSYLIAIKLRFWLLINDPFKDSRG